VQRGEGAKEAARQKSPKRRAARWVLGKTKDPAGKGWVEIIPKIWRPPHGRDAGRDPVETARAA
jgi:hypothetical protein